MLVAAGIQCMWPSTAGSIPAGWTRATAMDSTYPKGTAAGVDPDVTGGAATHTHTDPGHAHTIAGHTHSGTTSSTPNTGQTLLNGGAGNADHVSHTHTASTSGSSSTSSSTATATWNSVANDPAYSDVIWIASDGTPTGFPASAWAFWDKVASLPTNWSLKAASTFPRGAAPGGDGGATGGGGSHTHTATNHTHLLNAHTHTGGTSGNDNPGAGNFGTLTSGAAPQAIRASHTHAYTFDAGSTASSSTATTSPGGTAYEPTWAKLAVVQNDSGGQNIQVRHVAVWRGLLSAIPANWTLCDGTNSTVDMRGKFVKGATALGEIGNTGGTAGHSHSDPATHTHPYDHNHAETFANIAGTQNAFTSGAGTLVQPHGHSATSGTATGTSGAATSSAPATSDTQPPFRTVAFIALLSNVAVTITVPASLATITNPLMTVTWTFTGGSGTQNDYEVIIYRSDQTTVQWDSGQVVTATQTMTVPSGANLANSTTYYVKVILHDSGSLLGTSALTQFSTSWTPPATISGLTLTKTGGT